MSEEVIQEYRSWLATIQLSTKITPQKIVFDIISKYSDNNLCFYEYDCDACTLVEKRPDFSPYARFFFVLMRNAKKQNPAPRYVLVVVNKPFTKRSVDRF